MKKAQLINTFDVTVEREDESNAAKTKKVATFKMTVFS